MYHYTESGLNNIYLANGYHFHDTGYGRGVSIDSTENLHKAIGRWVISLPKPINGAELRFLRLEMETTQKDLAGIIGATEQTCRLWEKHRAKSIPGPADRLIRSLYSEFLGGDGSMRRMLERLAELDQLEHATACFQEANKRWRGVPAPCPSEEALSAS
jgi:putative transcriptional regulator